MYSYNAILLRLYKKQTEESAVQQKEGETLHQKKVGGESIDQHCWMTLGKLSYMCSSSSILMAVYIHFLKLGRTDSLTSTEIYSLIVQKTASP